MVTLRCTCQTGTELIGVGRRRVELVLLTVQAEYDRYRFLQLFAVNIVDDADNYTILPPLGSISPRHQAIHPW